MMTPMRIRGKELHVEVFGEQRSPAVLFLHGGPGESCYEFVRHQAEMLAAHLFVIAIDQRGVCRSEAILADEPFELQDLIEDCEDLRRQLEIKSWSVIGHSFGGYLGLMYAVRYPESIHKIVFECPTFHFGWTAKSLLKKASGLFESIGDSERSEQCLQLAEENLPAEQLFNRYLELGEALGDRKGQLYSNREIATDYSLYSDEEWDEFADRTDTHLRRLQEDGKMFESAVPLLSRLTAPSLLIIGDHDPVTCEHHVQAYSGTEQGRIVIVKDCGHTPHSEQPDIFCDTISRFIVT
ncbi:alpha/beta fold hydrolase [Paenibacillus sp. NPDC058071]|uniref:alpha/beta fold hydrolase n=1 Tax=Paenibacillus sp. NPDC058071 TaxID=3346326 RepID=UPI0036DA11EF